MLVPWGIASTSSTSPIPIRHAVIAVIRDDTADLIEDDPDRPCQAGDRLVLVGRPGSMTVLVQHLIG